MTELTSQFADVVNDHLKLGRGHSRIVLQLASGWLASNPVNRHEALELQAV